MTLEEEGQGPIYESRTSRLGNRRKKQPQDLPEVEPGEEGEAYQVYEEPWVIQDKRGRQHLGASS